MTTFNYEQYVSWPCELSELAQSALLSISEVMTGLKHIGLPPYASKLQGACFLTKGVAYMAMLNKQKKSSQAVVIGQGDWLGAISVDLFDTTWITHEELAPVELVFFPREKLQLLCVHHPEVYRFLFAITYDFAPRWANALAYSRCNKVEKVLFILAWLSQYVAKPFNEDSATLRVSQHQIATMANLSRPRVNEVLQDLKSQQLIDISREHMYFLDQEKLITQAKAVGFMPIEQVFNANFRNSWQ